MQSFNITSPFIDLPFRLSEGSFYESPANILRFVDIVGSAVYRVDLASGPDSLQKLQYEASISVTGALESPDDSFIFGGKYGIGISKKESNETQMLQVFWTEEEQNEGKPERMRANDGAVDSQGRFWVSAVNDPTVTGFTNEAVLFRYDTDGQLNRVIEGATIPNGISWSKDDKTMYYTDTADGKIYAYDFDVETGDISNKRDFFHPSEGGPDGHAQDEDGNLWVALWGAWKVVRVSPEGDVTAEVHLPTRCPTSVAFSDDAVYITSEEEHEPDTYPSSVRYAGRVFKADVGVKGRPSNPARIKAEVI